MDWEGSVKSEGCERRSKRFKLFKHENKKFLSTQDLICEFVEAIEENNFSNHMVGTTAENEIEISINYDTDQRKLGNELQDVIDVHNYKDEDDDESEDDD